MEITLTIPESLLTQLRQRAIQLNISLNELILNLLRKGIATEQPECLLPTMDEDKDFEAVTVLQRENRVQPKS